MSAARAALPFDASAFRLRASPVPLRGKRLPHSRHFRSGRLCAGTRSHGFSSKARASCQILLEGSRFTRSDSLSISSV